MLLRLFDKKCLGLGLVLFFVMALIVPHTSVFAQQEEAPAAKTTAPKTPTPKTPSVFEAKVRAANAATLVAGKTKINLWGIQDIEYMPASFQLRARTSLDSMIGNAPVQCEMKARRDGEIYAQCLNANDMDLSLYLIQQGFVSVDRSVIYGTVFEDPYIQAEYEAQNRSIGIWSESQGDGESSQGGPDGNLMLSFGFILFLCIIAAFTALSIIIMRGFQKVIDAQNQNVDFMNKERKLRDKERHIVAMMLDSELKANKAKIEAYLVVYEEMLKALKDPDRPPKYKKAGDILQKQPALDRSVFDKNADKLDTLGERLSSELIHFYARIKSKPDYTNLEPEMDVPQAIELVEKSVKNAQRLNKIAEGLMSSFSQGGMSSD